jgi:hypothetical protein
VDFLLVHGEDEVAVFGTGAGGVVPFVVSCWPVVDV